MGLKPYYFSNTYKVLKKYLEKMFCKVCDIYFNCNNFMLIYVFADNSMGKLVFIRFCILQKKFLNSN